MSEIEKRTSEAEAARMAESRLKDVEQAENSDEAMQELLDGALGVSKFHTIKIELSTGGPGDGFMLDFDQHGDLIGGSHYYVDWGFRKETPLSIEDASRVAEAYGVTADFSTN